MAKIGGDLQNETGLPGKSFFSSKALFDEDRGNYFSFTFVTEPIAHVIAGFLQLHALKSSAVEYQRVAFSYLVAWLCPNNVTAALKKRVGLSKKFPCDVHCAPQLYFIMNAYSEAQALYSKGARRNPLPFDFIGRLTHGDVQRDWDKLRFELQRHSGINMTRQLPAQFPHVEEYSSQNRKHRKLLGDLRGHETMPREVVRALCFVLLGEYYYLGFDLPRQCVNLAGDIDVKESELHHFCLRNSIG